MDLKFSYERYLQNSSSNAACYRSRRILWNHRLAYVVIHVSLGCVFSTFLAQSFVVWLSIHHLFAVETNCLVLLLRPLLGCPPNDLMLHRFSDSFSCAINHCDVITAVPTAGELKRFCERALESYQLTSSFHIWSTWPSLFPRFTQACTESSF